MINGTEEMHYKTNLCACKRFLWKKKCIPLLGLGFYA